MEYKEYGFWGEDGQEYIITDRKTPRHWYNYYYNNDYIAFASQVGFGEGFCQDDLGKRVKLVMDRCAYICDKQNNTFHTAVGLPMREQFDFYECRHGLGYSTVVCEKNGIRSEYTVFVPTDGWREVWTVKVTNLRSTEADLSVVGYAATSCDGPYTPQGYNNFSANYNPDCQAVVATVTSTFNAKKLRFVYDYMIASEKPVGYDTRKNAFIGTYDSKEDPEALVQNCGCTNSACVTEKICFALEVACKLGSGESKTVAFSVGYAESLDFIKNANQNFNTEKSESMLQEVKAQRLSETDGVFIETPDQNLNLAFNGFYKYATNMGSRWARVRHNGYRDMASDTECLGAFNPTLAWERFKRILTYQYPTGYCPRTFIDGAIKPNKFSDCAVWITFTAFSIINELGDVSLLQQEVLFNDGTSATVFEHLRRAVEYLYNFQGMHGLIKIWGGDWNDSMNFAGLKEQGVSVWLSIAWVRANKQFIELCKMSGHEDLVDTHEKMGADMQAKIQKYGWDGEYYITAINDKGEKIGSKESRGGNMYLNPQLWAVFADLLPYEELLKLMQTVDEKLETPLGTLVNNPGYDELDDCVGSMTVHPKGTLINQAVYLHPMAWKLAVEGIMKRPLKVQETLKKILPWNREYAPTCGEPYILYNFYHGPETEYRYGVPGQSWRTATTQWVTKALINFVFGLKPTLNGMVIDPCLPPEWENCSITKKFRGGTYKIKYHAQSSEKCICVNGVAIEGNLIQPPKTGEVLDIDVYM